MKKIISILMAAVFAIGMTIPAFASDEKAPLSFDADGSFTIMHVTDTHLQESNIDKSVWLIGQACDKEKPDLVVIGGDNVQNDDSAEITKNHITKLMQEFEIRGIPVAVTFGNHDSEEGALSREELMAFYNTFSCSYSVDDGETLSGCGTYNIPVLSSDLSAVKFNIWVFDSGNYDADGNYGYVKKDQIDWYRSVSDALALENGGEKVYSLAFQHIIVPEIYDVLKKADYKSLFTFEHIINDGDYYMSDPTQTNYGTLNETPCSGYYNDGQFDAMVQQGDVLGIFSGHDHTNAFAVKNQGINITNSLSTRYNDDAFSTQYGYRIIEINATDTSTYNTRVVHWYNMITLSNFTQYDNSTWAFGIAINGFFQKTFQNLYRELAAFLTGRTITYAD